MSEQNDKNKAADEQSTKGAATSGAAQGGVVVAVVEGAGAGSPAPAPVPQQTDITQSVETTASVKTTERVEVKTTIDDDGQEPRWAPLSTTQFRVFVGDDLDQSYLLDVVSYDRNSGDPLAVDPHRQFAVEDDPVLDGCVALFPVSDYPEFVADIKAALLARGYEDDDTPEAGGGLDDGADESPVLVGAKRPGDHLERGDRVNVKGRGMVAVLEVGSDGYFKAVVGAHNRIVRFALEDIE